MRMFLSVSGHSSELSIANHSRRSTVSQLKCVSDTISSWFENHQPHKTKVSQGWLDFSFPAFSSRFVDFAVQFCFRWVFRCISFHSTRSDARVRFDSDAIFLDQSQFFATHSNQWNCFILKRSKIPSNGFFHAKAEQKAGFRVMLKYFETKKAFRYYIKQIDPMLPCVWFSNRSQKTSKCGKNISDTLGYASCATFLFIPHFDAICDLLLNRRTATWNLFVE